jgi:hypothetical protein
MRHLTPSEGSWPELARQMQLRALEAAVRVYGPTLETRLEGDWLWSERLTLPGHARDFDNTQGSRQVKAAFDRLEKAESPDDREKPASR